MPDSPAPSLLAAKLDTFAAETVYIASALDKTAGGTHLHSANLHAQGDIFRAAAAELRRASDRDALFSQLILAIEDRNNARCLVDELRSERDDLAAQLAAARSELTAMRDLNETICRDQAHARGISTLSPAPQGQPLSGPISTCAPDTSTPERRFLANLDCEINHLQRAANDQGAPSQSFDTIVALLIVKRAFAAAHGLP